MPVFNHYIYNPLLYNPAATGKDSLGNAFINYRNQWTGINNSPTTATITFDSPLFKNRVGLGGTVYLDQTHIVQRVGASLNYAYHIPFSKTIQHRLSLGMAVGFINQRVNINPSELIISDGGTGGAGSDPLLYGVERTANTFDIAFGANYQYKGLNIGFSAPQLAKSALVYKDDADGATYPNGRFRLVRHYYGRVSYEFPFGPTKEYSLMPGLLVRHVSTIPLQVDGNVIIKYKKKAWLGFGYRSGNDNFATAGANVSVGAEMFKVFNFTVTYESLLDRKARSATSGTFEFLLGMKFGGTAKKLRDLERRLMASDERMRIRVDSSIIARRKDDADERRTMRETIKEVVRNEAKNDDRMRTSDRDMKAINTQVEEAQQRLKDVEDRIVNLENKAKNLASGTGANGIDNLPPGTVKPYAASDTLESVYFMSGSDFLTDYSKDKLNKAAATMLNNYDVSRIQVIIYGNSSQEGGSDENLVLSLKRAKAVKEYMFSLGLKTEFIVTIPNGEDKPITPTQENEEQRKLNRRVDILVLKPQFDLELEILKQRQVINTYRYFFVPYDKVQLGYAHQNLISQHLLEEY